ncbi:putative transposase [Conexivisphaera calida]|uniref:Putative transposase n=1 Tax=Conexivisphaera calida TaxID=1874277 RepID=A0A4P2VC25_9ARCH|nr:hypothetical protein NAS2_0024 [Conexivisphaera calida]BBE41503.1 hypothetical protein NAS2_0092 [Conexivisphaera calida]BBE41631.1 putative transposase [Conexivisphaera calida]
MALGALMAHLGALVDGRTARNAKYSSEALLRCLIHLSARGAYAESGLGALADNGHRVPSPDTLFYRLERVDPMEALEAMNDANAELLGHAPRGRGVPPMVAIDYTEEPYYGRRDSMVMRGKMKDGTTYFHTYATVSTVGMDERAKLTLHALPVTPFSSKEEVVGRLLEEAGSLLRARPSLLLMDRGFFAVEVLSMLQRMGMRFIVPAVANSRVKGIIEAYARGELPPVVEYRMGSDEEDGKGVDFYLVIARRRDAKDDDPPSKRYIAFATNVPFEDPEDMVRRIPEEYRARWGIETSYRVQDGFEAKTCSRSHTIRIVYFLLSVILYNSWAMMALMGTGRATTYRYRDYIAEEAVKVPWMEVGYMMGAG